VALWQATSFEVAANAEQAASGNHATVRVQAGSVEEPQRLEPLRGSFGDQSKDECGGWSYSGPKKGLLLWRIHRNRTSVLELSELKSSGDPGSQAYRVSLSSRICHTPSFSESLDLLSCNVFVLCEDGQAYRITFDHPEVRPSATDNLGISNAAVESALVKGVDRVAATAAVGRTLCIGDDTGVISCLPFQETADGFQLKEGTMQRLWKGIKAFTPSKAKQSCGVVSLHNIMSSALPSACLVSVHADSSVHIWDLSKKSRASLVDLHSAGTAIEDLVPYRCWLEGRGGKTENGDDIHRLLIESGSSEASEDSPRHYGLYELRPTFSGLSILYLGDLATEEGTLEGVCFASNNLWALCSQVDRTVLASYSYSDTGAAALVRLLEDEVSEMIPAAFSYDEGEEGAMAAEAELEYVLQYMLDQAENSGPTSYCGAALSDYFVDLMLTPNICSRWALRDLFVELNSGSASAGAETLKYDEVASLTREGLKQELIRTLQALVGPTPSAADLLHGWAQVTYKYLVMWRAHHRVVGICTHDDTIVTVASRGVGLVRSMSFIEQLRHDAAIDAGSLLQFTSPKFELPEDLACSLELGKSDSEDVSKLVILSCALRHSMGTLPWRVFEQHLGKESDCIDVALEHTRLLQLGYREAWLSVPSSDAARHRRDLRAASLRTLGVVVTSTFAKLSDPYRALQDLLRVYEWPQYQPVVRMATDMSGPGEWMISAAACTGRQLACTYASGAREALLLLGYLARGRSLCGLSSHVSNRINEALLEKSKSLAWRNGLFVSLCTTWGVMPLSDDFANQLPSVSLGSSGPVAPSAALPRTVQSSSLFQALLPETWGALQSPSSDWSLSSLLQTQTLELMCMLRWGEKSVLEGEDCTTPVQFLTMISSLYYLRQYDPLRDILELAAQPLAGVERCAMDFFLGLCHLACLPQDEQDRQVAEESERRAEACFIHAASGLLESDEAGSALWQVLPILQLVGEDNLSGTSLATRHLAYLEAVMRLFERRGAVRGARSLARAAVRQADSALSDTPGLLLETVGRLWVSIFSFSVELQEWDEAYCAVVTNPVKPRSLECLRRLVTVLAEHREYEVLCSFPMSEDGMLESTENALESKAESAAVSAEAPLYRLLYTFHMKRGNFRRAASCMYRCSSRMRWELPGEISARCSSLLVAINALMLVKREHAFVETPRTVESPGTVKRPRLWGHNDTSEAQQAHVLSLEDLERQYALDRANLQLAEVDALAAPGYQQKSAGSADLPSTVRSLTRAGLFDMAVSMALKYVGGEESHRLLQFIVEELTRRAVLAQLSESQHLEALADENQNHLMLPATPSPSPYLGHGDYFTETPSKEHRVVESKRKRERRADAQWKLLRSHLQRLDTVERGYRLRIVAADTILSLEACMKLPQWLVCMLKEGVQSAGGVGETAQIAPTDQAAVIRLFVKHGLLQEAVDFVMELADHLYKLNPVERKKSFSMWFPYSAVDSLREVLDASRADVFALRERLHSGMEAHLRRIWGDATDARQLMAAHVAGD